jgi:PAS domain S-box-containing protein
MEEYVWISRFTKNPVYQFSVYPILKRIAAEFNVNVSIEGSEKGRLEPYIDAVYSAVSRKVAGIMLVGYADNQAVVDAVNQAVHLGIPVITVETDLPSSERLAHVGANWFKMGQSMADYLAKMINGPGKILMLGRSGLPNIEAGFRGFSQQIKNYSDIQLLGPENDAGENFNTAEKLVADYLKKYPDLSGIVAMDYNGGPGAAEALEKFLKVRTVKLVCTEADEPQVDFIKKGLIDASFTQKYQYSTYLAFQMLYAYNHGSPTTGKPPGLLNIPGNIDTGHIIVTKDNVDKFKSGFDIEEALSRHHLAQKVKLYTHMLDNVNEIVLACDIYGKIFYASPATQTYLGYTPETLCSLEIKSILEISDQFIKCLDDGGCKTLETYSIKKDNSRFPMQISISPLKSEKGISGYVIIAMDISERKKAEKLLKETEARYRGIFETSVDGILVADILTKDLVYANPSISKMLGYSIDELLNLNVRDIHPTDKLSNVINAFELQARGEEKHAIDIPCLTKNGKIVYCDVSATVVKHFIMNRDCLIGFFRNAEARKKMQMQAEEKQETINSIFRAAPVGIGLVSNRVIKWTNQRISDLLGYSAEELKEQSSRILYASEEEFNRVGEIKYAQIREKGIGTVETVWKCKDGTIKQILLSSTYIDSAIPEKGAIFTALDLSKIKNTEQILVDSERKFKHLIEMCPDVIWEIDNQGRFTYVSAKAKDILGYETDELISRKPFEFMPEVEADKIENLFEKYVKERMPFERLEKTVLHKNGQKLFMETSGSPFFDDNGNFLGYRGIDRDITERRELLDKLKEKSW